MIILDAHLPPALAVWITESLKIPCFSAQFLDLRHAEDQEIFAFSKERNAIVITKDDDFVSLLNRKPAEGDLAHLRKHIQKQIKRNLGKKLRVSAGAAGNQRPSRDNRFLIDYRF